MKKSQPLARIRRILSLSLAKTLSAALNVWRSDKFDFSPEEWRQMRISFADSGEDLVVLDFLRRFPENRRGIYIDAGAFDPVLISNTLLLYKCGWKGLIVDANPATIEKFHLVRPRDRAVLCALSDKVGEFKYLEYPLPGNNRLAQLDSLNEKSMIGEKPVKNTCVQARTLEQILFENYRESPQIDFLSIDCEGHDHMVLTGLNLSKHRPKLICIESHQHLVSDNENISRLLASHNYHVLASLGLNLIFADGNL